MAKKPLGYLTVGQLKAKLALLEDDTRVLLPSQDHSYRPADYFLETVVHHKNYGVFSEYYDDSQLEDADDVVLPAVVVFR